MAMVDMAPPNPEEALYISTPHPKSERLDLFRVVHARAERPVAAAGPAVRARFNRAWLDRPRSWHSSASGRP